jgi:antitoxin component YwqK of YwqJK toxin-antitoxin module
MKNGKRDSLNTWYYESGKTAIQYYYHEGVLEGESVSFSQDGIVIEKGNYHLDLKEGEWIENYDSGKLKAKGKYIAGQKQGAWKYYDEHTENIVKTVVFKNGIEKTKSK